MYAHKSPKYCPTKQMCKFICGSPQVCTHINFRLLKKITYFIYIYFFFPFLPDVVHLVYSQMENKKKKKIPRNMWFTRYVNSQKNIFFFFFSQLSRKMFFLLKCGTPCALTNGKKNILIRNVFFLFTYTFLLTQTTNC